jgi:hypothetical protein
MTMGGSWSAYWYNGHIVSSEIARGLDIFELLPSAYLTRNEIDAANSVHFDYFNTQGQPKLVWPPSFSLARAYVDQLERSNGLGAARIASIRQTLANAENVSGARRVDTLSQLATQVDADVSGSRDPSKVRMLASSVKDLAAASR